MKSILIIAYSNLENDPRVRRQIENLNHHYIITTVGWKPAQIEGIRFYPINHNPRTAVTKVKQALELKFHCYEGVYYQQYDYNSLIQTLKQEQFHLIIANDVETLPFAFAISTGKNIPVICDAHEYSPAQFQQQFKWRFLYKRYNEYICRTYLKKCAHMFTVGEGIALEYHRRFGVKPTVLTNATEKKDLKPKPCDPQQIRLIHHGGAQPPRKLERMIHMMEYVDNRFSLDLMLMPGRDTAYLNYLKQLSQNMPNISFTPPVPMIEISQSINEYDIGIYFLEPVNFNYKMALPNKFFEFIQARLALVIGPSEEMARLTKRYQCGLVVESFNPKDIARKLNQLTGPQIDQYKQKSHLAADQLTAEKNMEILGQIVRDILKE